MLGARAPSPPLLRSRFFWWVALGHALAALLLVFFAGWVARATKRQGLAKAAVAAQIAAESLLERAGLQYRADPAGFLVPPAGGWNDLVASPSPRLRLSLFTSQSSLLADSEATPDRWQDHSDREELRSAIATGAGSSTRFSATVGKVCCYHALAFVEGTGSAAQVGFLARAAVPVDEILAASALQRNALLAAGALVALLGILHARLLSARLAHRGAVLASSAQARYAAIDWPELQGASEAIARARSEHDQRLYSLAADRNKVLAILASMVEGVVAVDADDRVVHLNAVAAALLRLDPSKVEGERIWEVTRAVEVCSILEQARQGARELDGETVLGAGTSDERRIELRASALRDHDGAIAGSVVVLNDVTRLRRLESLRRDFVANVSHELKTPLTAIRGLIETLIDDQDMDAKVRLQFMTRIQDQAGRLSNLVGDLLTLARVESAERNVELISLDVVRSLKESAARFEPMCAAKQIDLKVDLPVRTVHVRGEEESLRQIVDNLLDNAVKYTPSGGRITLRLACVVARADAGSPEREWARIEVQDTGIGIEPGNVERVFERFYRVDRARSRELGGTGLGLSIVKNMAQALGGSVSLRSTPGRGSTFGVQVPIEVSSEGKRPDS